jgi:hypothetical protein
MMTTSPCDIRHVFIISFPLTSFSRKKQQNKQTENMKTAKYVEGEITVLPGHIIHEFWEHCSFWGTNSDSVV